MSARKPIRSWTLLGLGVMLITLAALSVSNATEPQYTPRNSRSIAGSLSVDPGRGALMEDVQICSCWQGPAGQAQKKVRFRITNNTDRSVFRLTGGQEGSVFLLVGYSRGVVPVVTAPPKHQVGDLQSMVGTPADRVVFTSTSGSARLKPDEITNPTLLEDLDPPEGWRVWGIPANHNMMVESLSPGMATYPTYVEIQDLNPGEIYSGDELGVGVWVFYVPYPPELEGMASSPIVPSMATTTFTDDYYIIYGVAIVDDSGRIRGFAPTPPESQWTDASSL